LPMPSKESRELYLIEKFIPVLFEGQSCGLLQLGPPAPDIIIAVHGKRIGIEQTDIVFDSSIVMRESKQARILSKAQALYESRLQLPIHVTTDFLDEACWERVNIEQVAAFLANKVVQYVSSNMDNIICENHFNIKIKKSESKYVDKIGVSYFEKISTSAWSPITGFCVPDISVSMIQNIIDRKNKHINGYLISCDEVWLLLTETGAPSSYFSDFEKLQPHTFESGFAKTMIGRVSKGELLMLKTTPQL